MEKTREEWERIFCWKIHAELKGFRYRILQQEKEEIYAAAYQIDSMIRIFELLVERSQYMDTEILKMSISIPNVLAFLYDRWLHDVHFKTDGLEKFLKEELKQMKERRMTA